MSQHQKVGALLLQLRETLVQHGHWQSQAPSDEKLASSEPFAVDTLSCTEWLQWIFIPKMQFLVDHHFPLPDAFNISPYVDEALKGANGHLEITQVTMTLDALMPCSAVIVSKYHAN
ncbi:YqcC family protein [Enterovibrio sp. ZSDZ35]|uniref:YqcC family protein n=1 Tax=Enterovibrio qingdaonensis TaxID=2899818 RepID=A0ABT5QS90_9GAMM|nr:YqcC family protein [Enterovibrio sp. ZSDZ35]MDD1783769.1 YqcC family protein [Enterovibrio sp. ZSDZ35]